LIDDLCLRTFGAVIPHSNRLDGPLTFFIVTLVEIVRLAREEICKRDQVRIGAITSNAENNFVNCARRTAAKVAVCVTVNPIALQPTFFSM